jgi:hypothetical protein
MSSIYKYHSTRRLTPLAPLIACTLGALLYLPPVVSILFVTVLTTCVGVVAYRLNNFLLTILSAAFLSRIAIVVVDSTINILPTIPISSGHNRRAIELVIAWSNGQLFGVLGGVSPMRVLMAHLLAPFYAFLGKTPMAGRIGIAFISLLIGYLVFQLARPVTDRQTATLAASAVLFWPTIVARSVVIQREIVIVVAILLFLWAAVQWIDSITFPTVVVASIATTSIFVLRKENLFLIAVMVGFVSLVKSRDKPYYLAGLTLLATPFLTYFALNFGQFTGFGTTLSPTAIDSFAHGRAHGDAAYLVNLHYNSWLDVVLYVPIKIMYYLYTPFPWQIRGITELLVGLSAFALLTATLFVRRGIAILHDKPYYVGLLLSYLLTGILTYSIIEMNYGAAVRRRIQFIPIILIFAVIGLSNVEFDVRWPER